MNFKLPHKTSALYVAALFTQIGEILSSLANQGTWRADDGLNAGMIICTDDDGEEEPVADNLFTDDAEGIVAMKKLLPLLAKHIQYHSPINDRITVTLDVMTARSLRNMLQDEGYLTPNLGALHTRLDESLTVGLTFWEWFEMFKPLAVDGIIRVTSNWGDFHDEFDKNNYGAWMYHPEEERQLREGFLSIPTKVPGGKYVLTARRAPVGLAVIVDKPDPIELAKLERMGIRFNE